MLSDSNMICPREMTHWLPAPNRTLSLCVSLDQTTHFAPISRVENTNAGEQSRNTGGHWAQNCGGKVRKGSRMSPTGAEVVLV